MRTAWMIATACLAAWPIRAEPLSFDQAVAQAVADGPSVRAALLKVDAARSEAKAAGQLPDPTLSVGVENFPVSGPAAGRLSADSMTMRTIGVEQAAPSGAKRRAQRDRARSDIAFVEAASSVAIREVRVLTALAWLDLYYARRRLEAIDRILETLGPLLVSADAGVASGGSRPAQAIETGQSKAALEDQRSELLAATARARAELARWTGDPDADARGDPPVFAVDAAALRADLNRNPTLRAYDAGERQAQADVRLARAEKRPDWSFGVTYGRRDASYGDMVSATATVSLPLFGERRQDPMIAARLADADRVRVEREAARRALLARLESDLADHAAHHERWMRASTVLLPLARQRADLETASYGAGRADLADVLDAFTELAGVQLETLDREAMAARDGARIRLTYGGEDQ